MKNKYLTILLLILSLIIFVFSCKDKAVSPSDSYVYKIPEQTNDGWETTSLNSVGIIKQPIISLIDKIQNEEYKNVHSILIIKQGKLVFEEYFEGEKFKLAQYTGVMGFERDDLHNLCSATKSFTSACIGICIDQGLIQNANQKVFDFFPEHADLLNDSPDKKRLTLDHLLTMSSGIDWNDAETSYYEPQNDMNRIFNNSDPTRYMLAKPLVWTPGNQFEYQNVNTNILGEIVRRASEYRVDVFCNKYIFSKLGISSYEWQMIPNDVVLASGELKLRPRDMAKFGLLFLNKGVWDGEQLISQDWIEVSTRKHFTLNGWQWADGYGYQWWHNTFHTNNNSYSAYFADGWGGQTIYVFDELDMIVVFTGGNYYDAVPNGELCNAPQYLDR